MRPDQASLWYRRSSVVYAVGTWTLLGSLYFFSRKQAKLRGGEVEQKDLSRNEITEPPPKGFYVETITTNREDFVPFTDRILNYWNSWTGGPGPKS